VRSKNIRSLHFLIFIFLTLSVLLQTTAIAQTAKYEKTFYGGLFYLTNFMMTDEYMLFHQTHTDLETVDFIYDKALKFFNEDASEACFCLTFVLLPYNKILMKLPVIGSTIKIPLPSPPNYVFKEKLKNTPKQIFYDSPIQDSGDKDKLAHFFSNAFLKYNTGIFNLSEFLGIFVEYFEKGFFIQGSYDLRDLIANHLGELFAEMLKKNINSKPSEALKVYQLLYFRLNP
jgi:hypothetical protein